MIKKCKNCGREFETSNNRQIYCCSKCARASKTKQELQRRKKAINGVKTCAYCGKKLTNVAHKQQKYCSDSCKRAAELERLHRKRPLKRLHLCWSCKKYINGCSWSRMGKPVKGWKATGTPRMHRGKTIGISYRVHQCPEYVRGN